MLPNLAPNPAYKKEEKTVAGFTLPTMPKKDKRVKLLKLIDDIKGTGQPASLLP